MPDLSQHDPTGRFTGLADNYARYRPSYPAQALDHIRARAGLRLGSIVVDVGCGTGISARLFASLGMKVIGVEPNADMRLAAEAVPPLPNEHPVIYRDGQAEATGVADGVADLVLAAQAFHWFRAEEALIEFRRILRPDGWVALVWNEDDEQDMFTMAHDEIVRSARDAAVIEKARHGDAGKALLTSPLFSSAELTIYPNQQALDLDGLLGRTFSISYAPRDPAEIAAWTERLIALHAQHQRGGTVVLRYLTSVYMARGTR